MTIITISVRGELINYDTELISDWAYKRVIELGLKHLASTITGRRELASAIAQLKLPKDYMAKQRIKQLDAIAKPKLIKAKDATKTKPRPTSATIVD